MSPLRTLPAALRAATLFAVVAAAGLASAQPKLPATPALASGIDRSAIDPKVRPQDDFYTHANGAWLRRAVFPADKAYIGPAMVAELEAAKFEAAAAKAKGGAAPAPAPGK